MKQVRIELDEAQHTLLKQKCLERGISMRQLVKNTLAEYLDGEYIGGNLYVLITEEEHKVLQQRCRELGNIDESEFIKRILNSDEALKAIAREMFSPDD